MIRTGIMLPFLLFVTQLLDQSVACDLYGRDYDHGQDYLSWTSVDSLALCKYKCKNTYNCDGITWIKDYNRNCALYDSRGTRSGVTRRGQDSYINCNLGAVWSVGEGACSEDRDCGTSFTIYDTDIDREIEYSFS